MALAHGAVGAFALVHIVITDAAVATEEQTPWLPIPSRASAVLSRLGKVRRPPDREHDTKDDADPGHH